MGIRKDKQSVRIPRNSLKMCIRDSIVGVQIGIGIAYRPLPLELFHRPQIETLDRLGLNLLTGLLDVYKRQVPSSPSSPFCPSLP